MGNQGILKGEGSITVLLISCLTGLDKFVLQIKIKILSCHTADSKQVKQEVNGTVILPPLVFPGVTTQRHISLQKYTSTKPKVLVAGTNKADGLTSGAAQQGGRADKWGAVQQGRRSDKWGSPTRQAGQVNRCAHLNCQDFCGCD